MDESNRIKQWGSKGETLVFLHYFGGSAQSWQWVADILSSDYRCIAINLPGFGGSPAMVEPTIQGFAAYVQEELNAIGISSYTLIGHSMGGKIAMQMAANAPKGTVRQLILVAPSPPTTEPMAEEEKKRMLQHPSRSVAENTVDGATKKDLRQEQYSLAVETQLIIDENTWSWWILEGMNNSIEEIAQNIEIPILVLASQDDPVMTPDVIEERVMRVLRDARLRNTQGVGHLIPLESPQWLTEQIRKAVEND